MSRPKKARAGLPQEKDNLDAEQQNAESRYPKKRSRYQKGDLGHLVTTKKTSRYQKKMHPPETGKMARKPIRRLFFVPFSYLWAILPNFRSEASAMFLILDWRPKPIFSQALSAPDRAI